MSNFRNVMLVISDDWSPLAACYGNDVVQTPRIDAFAQEAMVFDHAFCCAPTCSASRANILTGQYAHTNGHYGHCHGIHGFSTHEWMSSLVQDLNGQNFATALIGKSHVAPQSVYPFEFEPQVDPRDPLAMAEHARQFLDQNTERPFYLHVASAFPHRAGPKDFGNERPCPGHNDVVYDPESVPVPNFLPDLPGVRDDLADYYQAVSRYDYFVGVMLDVLAEAGRADETLVIVMSDHGMPFPGAKASMFEGGHHCPLLIRTPDKQTGHTAALVNWVDLRPTIQAWCGVELSEALPGRSLLPLLDQPDQPGWETTYYSHCFHEVIDYNPYRVIRTPRYKYVQNLAPGVPCPLPTDLFRSRTWDAVRESATEMMGERPTHHMRVRAPEELYDLQADPAEAVNRIDDPDLQAIAADLRQRLYALRQETRDFWLEADYQFGRFPTDPFEAGILGH